MIAYPVLVICVLCPAIVVWVAMQRRSVVRARAAAAETQLNVLYTRYFAEIQAATQEHLLRAPSDEQWITEIQNRIELDFKGGQDSLSQESGYTAEKKRRFSVLLYKHAVNSRLTHRQQRIRSLRFRQATRSPGIEQLLIGGHGKTAGGTVLQHLLSSLASKADRLRVAQATLRIRANYVNNDIVEHPDGGVQATRDQGQQRELITADIRRGSYRHRRLPAALHRIPLLVYIADVLLLLYFFSGITNVNWSRPFSAALAFAVLLAAMITSISFAFFRFTGDRLQQYKDDTGTIPLRGLDEATSTSTLSVKLL